MKPVLVVVGLVASAAAQCGSGTLTDIDFGWDSSPRSPYMEWVNALGTTYTGTQGANMLIDSSATDQDTGAFPGGNVRFRNVGEESGIIFDIVVTVIASPHVYSSLIDIAYTNPTAAVARQAVLTTAGFACLGVGLLTATCASGSTVAATTAECQDNTPTTMKGAEYRFDFVVAGTNTPTNLLTGTYVTFWDVDGDSINEGAGVFESVYEMNSVWDAVSYNQDATSTLNGGNRYATSGQLYTIATQAVNVDTNFARNPNVYPRDPPSLVAVGEFFCPGLQLFSGASRRAISCRCCHRK